MNCRHCHEPMVCEFVDDSGSSLSAEESYAYNVFNCGGCGMIAKESMWANPGVLWISALDDKITRDAVVRLPTPLRTIHQTIRVNFSNPELVTDDAVVGWTKRGSDRRRPGRERRQDFTPDREAWVGATRRRVVDRRQVIDED